MDWVKVETLIQHEHDLPTRIVTPNFESFCNIMTAIIKLYVIKKRTQMVLNKKPLLTTWMKN